MRHGVAATIIVLLVMVVGDDLQAGRSLPFNVAQRIHIWVHEFPPLLGCETRRVLRVESTSMFPNSTVARVSDRTLRSSIWTLEIRV